LPEIEAILILLVAVAALATLANKIKVPYPGLLVLGGLVLGFVPGLPRVELHPEVVFLLFLPPLIYVSAIFTSWRDFRANLRPISLLAVGLVLITTCVVAVVAHWTKGLPWAYQRLSRELLRAQRRYLIELRNEDVIGDEAMHRIERDLDLEESRLEA
jgi:NhaP-type Na+/H+ or K+/H+ antiporter